MVSIQYYNCLRLECLLFVMLAVFGFVLVFPAFVGSCLASGFQKGAKAEVVWEEGEFTIGTTPLADGKTAIWSVTKDGTFKTDIDTTVTPYKATGVLKVFDRQSEQRKKRGIFIYSSSYAVSNLPEEKQWMSLYLKKLYDSPEWRRSEASLIEDLRRECEKHGILLYVNTSMNMQGKWKKLAPTGAKTQRSRKK